MTLNHINLIRTGNTSTLLPSILQTKQHFNSLYHIGRVPVVRERVLIKVRKSILLQKRAQNTSFSALESLEIFFSTKKIFDLLVLIFYTGQKLYGRNRSPTAGQPYI